MKKFSDMLDNFKCTFCKEEKDISNFYITAKGYRVKRCKKCHITRVMNRKVRTHCSKCNSEKEKVDYQAYCKKCNSDYSKSYRKDNYVYDQNFKEMVAFVKKIQSRGGWATTREVFVDLIGYGNIYCVYNFLNMPTSKQLEITWRGLVKIVEEYEKKK